MLTALRSKSSKFVLKILFVILIASFAVWGIGDIFRSGGRTMSLIEVGPVTVTQTELQAEYQRQMVQLQSLYGSTFDAETARALGLVNRVVSDVVARSLLAVYTQQIGMRVTDDAVRQVIQGDATFRNDLGQFDRGRFEAWLSRNGMSEGDLVARLRGDIARNQLTASLITGVQAPQSLVSAVHDYRGEQRVAQTLRLAAADMPDVPVPTDAALEAFHQENVDRYQAPEYRALTILRLSPEDLAKEIQIADDEIAAAFENRRHEFDQPERRHLDQIVFPDEAAAKAAAEKLAAGGDFVEIAREATGGAPIDLGTVDKNGLAGSFAELADAAFTTPAGQVTAPTMTVLGWHLVRVLSVEPARAATLAEHREEVAYDLALEQAHDSIVSIANQLEDELAGGAALEEIGDKLDLPLTKVEAVDATGRTPDGATVDAVTREPGLASLAFETEAGALSPLSDSTDGGYYVLRVDGITPAATRPLAEVRDQVAVDWLAAERAKAAAEKAASVVEQLNGGADIAALAAELGREVKTSLPLTRDGEDVAASLDPVAVETLFTLKQGEAAAVAAEDDQVILRLAEIRAPADGGDPVATAELRDTLRRDLANDVVSQFMAALQQEVPVSVDQDAIDRLF
jgi:peptidyl-prolyl cis-trans isomerase D